MAMPNETVRMSRTGDGSTWIKTRMMPITMAVMMNQKQMTMMIRMRIRNNDDGDENSKEMVGCVYYDDEDGNVNMHRLDHDGPTAYVPGDGDGVAGKVVRRTPLPLSEPLIRKMIFFFET